VVVVGRLIEGVADVRRGEVAFQTGDLLRSIESSRLAGAINNSAVAIRRVLLFANKLPIFPPCSLRPSVKL
jgi:hypothetical protein